MAENGARLVATLEARVNRFERDLERANSTARRQFGDIERRGDEMSRRLQRSVDEAGDRVESRLGRIARGFNAAASSLKAGIAGFAAGAAGAFSIEGIQASIADLAKLNDTAEKTGASAKFLQELAFAVEQSGGEASDAAAGMEKFSLAVSKAAAGGGDLAELFAANGVAIRGANGAMKPIEEQLRLVADLIKNAENEQDQLNIASMAFGKSAGPAMVLALAGGRAGVAAFAEEMRAAGILIGDDMVQQAAKLDDQIAKTTRQMDSLGKQMLLEAGPAIEAGLELGLAKLREFSELINAIRNVELSKLGKFLFSRTGPGALYNAFKPAEPTDDLGKANAEKASLEARIAALKALSHATPGAADGANANIALLQKQLDSVEARIKSINEMKVEPGATALDPIDVKGKPTVIPPEGDGGRGSSLGSGEAIRDFVRQVVKAESGGRADAKNPNSTATGAGQFIETTWLGLFRKHYPEAARTMGESAILALRRDADVSKEMIEKYAEENAAALRGAGVAVTSANLHLAHFLGPQGAINTVKAAPGASTNSFLGSDQITANKSILQGKTREDVLAYGDRRANATRLAAGDLTADEEAINRKAEAVKKVVDALALESAQIGQTAVQQRVMQELQTAGVDLSSKEGQAIAAKVQQLYTLKDASEQATASAERLREAQQAFADLGADATKGILSDLRDGKSAADALGNALDRIIGRLSDMVVDNLFSNLFPASGGGAAGGGLLAGIGKLFGGGRARGGPVSSNRAYIVGEKRPELFVPNTAGRIVPKLAPALPAMRPMQSAAPVVNVSSPPTTVNVVGAPAGARVQERQDGRGGKTIDVILDEKVGAMLKKPGSEASSSLVSTYGARIRPRRIA